MKGRVAFWIVLAFGALLLLVGSGDVPLLDPDESRFARTSVEMVRSGDPVVPRFEGLPRLVKPPLIHWIQSFLFRTLGVSEGVARLHSALATLGSMFLVGWICRQRFGGSAGPWAAVVLITMPLVLALGRVGSVDALLAVHVLAAVTLDLLAPEDEGPYPALVIGALLGLAFLTKGPVGVVLPLLLILAGRTALGRELLPAVGTLLRVVAAWCAVVLPWGLVFLRRVGFETTAMTLRSEVLDRYYAGTAHVQPPWYYAPVLAVGLAPWIGPLLAALVRTWRLRRLPDSRTARYAAAGLIAGLAFFSLSQSKLATYLLPLTPLAAILITWELGQEIQAPRVRTLGSTLLAATLAAGAILLGHAGAFQLEGQLAHAAAAGGGLYGCGALLAFHGALRHRPAQVYAVAAATAAAFLLLSAMTLHPHLGHTRSAADLIRAVPALEVPSRPLVTVEIKVPSLTFYLDRVPEVLEIGELEERMAQDDAPLFVLADVDLPRIPAHLNGQLREVGRHGKYRVLEERLGLP